MILIWYHCSTFHIRDLRPRHTYPFLFENGHCFLRFGWVKTVTKRIFSKTLSRVEIFKNVGFSITCGLTKTEIFKYDNVIHHMFLAWRMFNKGCYRFSIVFAFLCGRRKRFEYATCGCVLFWKRRKKSPCSKISGYVWTRRRKIGWREGRENVKKKNNKFNKQNNNFARATNFFFHTRDGEIVLFLFLNSRWTRFLGGFVYIWQSKWVGIITMKTEIT